MEHASHRARPQLRAGVSVMLVLALAGMLFTANARLARTSEGQFHDSVTDLLASQVEEATERVAELEDQVAAERSEVGRLVDVEAPGLHLGDPELTAVEGVVSGAVETAGPGLTVVLDDAPTSRPQAQDVAPDSLVVHQQDLEAVINALWAGGAEAMTLQDQRVLSTTAFRCVGNVLSLHGRVYSPPYRIQAVGDPAAMQAALDASDPVRVYREWVDAVGLGWSVTAEPELVLPGGSTDLRHASVPDGVEVLP